MRIRGHALTCLLLLAVLVAGAPPAAAQPTGTIAYSSNREAAGGADYAIYLMNADGSGKALLVDGALTGAPAWSSDGSRLAWVDDGEIWVANADGSGVAQVTSRAGRDSDDEDRNPAWAPDGTIVFDRRADDDVRQLYRIAPDGTGLVQLTTFGMQSNGGNEATDPSVGPDGRITYIRETLQEGCFVCPAVNELAVVGADGSGHRAFPETRGAQDPAWSPDGSRIAFSAPASGPGEHDIHTIAPDGSGLQAVAATPELSEFEPSWSPDGAHLAFSSSSEMGSSGEFDSEVYVMPATGGAATNISQEDGPAGDEIDDEAPAWRPAGGAPLPPPTDPTPPPPGPTPPPPPPSGAVETFDGDAATTERIDVTDPVQAAIGISQLRFPTAGGFAQGAEPAQWAVLSRDDAFPDSLAGAVLANFGPLLYTDSEALTPATAAEIDRVLDPGGFVYILGGTGAVSAGIEGGLRGAGYTPIRLAGPSRVETALAVADEALHLFGSSIVLLARANPAPGNETSGWADSVTGGALAAYFGIPVLITTSGSLHPAVDEWLSRNATQATFLLGGTAALSTEVEQAVPSPRRVSGPERTATAAAIATQLWEIGTDVVPRSYLVIDGGDPQGWMFGLAAAGLAYDHESPMLMVTDRVTEATASLVSECGAPQVDLLLVGSASVIGEDLRQQLDQLDGSAC